MINDPELKAMSEVYDALHGLDGTTQKRVVDWVLAKLQSPNTGSSLGTKRGLKPGLKRGRKSGTRGKTKNSGKKSPGGRRGRPSKNTTAVS